jgi:hypothetical protein
MKTLNNPTQPDLAKRFNNWCDEIGLSKGLSDFANKVGGGVTKMIVS